MATEDDPFTQVFNELWRMAEISTPLQSLIKAGNKIKFSNPNNPTVRGPVKDQVNVSDLPELVLSTIGSTTANIHASSSTTQIQREYSWILSTGDFRTNYLLFPVQFAIYSAMTNWMGNLTALMWRENQFVKRCNYITLQEGLSNPQLNRGIKGWSSLWACSVDMHFRTSDLQDFNLGL